MTLVRAEGQEAGPTALSEQLSSWPVQAHVPHSVYPPPGLPVGEGVGEGGEEGGRKGRRREGREWGREWRMVWIEGEEGE